MSNGELNATADMAERWRQYQICQIRGHKPSGIRLSSNPPMDVCKHCGTQYWVERVVREINVPNSVEGP